MKLRVDVTKLSGTELWHARLVGKPDLGEEVCHVEVIGRTVEDAKFSLHVRACRLFIELAKFLKGE